MAKCIIKSEKVIAGDISEFEVIFEADDGYQEAQRYQCTEAKLKEALTHFNDAHLESVVASVTPVEVEDRELTVKSSKEAVANLKKIEEAAGVEEENAE